MVSWPYSWLVNVKEFIILANAPARLVTLCVSNIGKVLDKVFYRNLQRIAKPSLNLVEEITAAVVCTPR
ncbi:hypothetical protein PF003_g25544 [Phytophthora fragariae]|nr:hypothetical protein PF003_g25544 [Phytophthora fragariae]